MDVLTTRKENGSFLQIGIIVLAVMVSLSLVFMLLSIPVHSSARVSDWESLDVSISDFVLRTETPEIELTSEQIAEITALHSEGMEFEGDPNDPCQKLKLLGLKKLNKWVNQFKKRGFTVAKIRETLKMGTRMTYNHPSGTNFTRIIHPDGSCIIVDFVECVIWQIAPPNFKF